MQHLRHFQKYSIYNRTCGMWVELVAHVPEATPYAATTAAACPVTKQGEKL